MILSVWIAGHGEGHRTRDEGFALGVDRLDPHLVLPARQAAEDDGVALAVIRPEPRQIVERDVQVPDGSTVIRPVAVS